VTTPLLFHFLEANPAPSAIVVMIQHEVARRILARAGTKEYGVLTLGVAVRARASLCFTVPAGAFRPPPKVKSAVIRIVPRAEPLLPDAAVGDFMAVVRAALGQRRKTLRNALGTLIADPARIDTACAGAGIDPAVRGETLDLDAYLRLTRALFPER
jgi:16S rRNA (adenine1518-N6/adenine1519-N6)-dimethyltransferase